MILTTTLSSRRPSHRASRPRRPRLLPVLLAAGLTAGLGACSDEAPDAAAPAPAASASTATGDATSPTATSSGSTTSTAAHDDADVLFAQQMIAHHEGALTMAALVPGRTDDPAVRDLARRIREAQEPEIAQMRALLDAWGVSGAGMEGMHGTDHGDVHEDLHGSTSSAPMTDEEMGMMSAAATEELEAARGDAFDRLWLTAMLAHHQGAVAMARAELASGSNPQARELARSVEQAQAAEISEMQDLLAAG